MDDADTDPWSAIASQWQQRWGRFAAPVWDELIVADAIVAGQRVLDVGCGSGELVAHLEGLGLSVAGVDPSPAMVALARSVAPAADVRVGVAEALPWDDDTFDLTVAVNALHLTDDADRSLEEMIRVTVGGGRVAVVGWAESSLNDLDVVHAALAHEDGVESPEDDELRAEGGLADLLEGAGLSDVRAGLVEVRLDVADDDALVRAVMLGEDEATMASYASVVVAAARPFQLETGAYRLTNHLRTAVGCTAVGCTAPGNR